MKQLISRVMALLLALAMLAPSDAMAQRRRVVRVRHPRVAFVLRAGHPIRRALPAAVVVRAARTAVVVTTPLVFLPVMVWRPAVVKLPARERLMWQDSETIDSDDGWVDTNYGVDATGNALFLEVAGKAQLNFAEVTFANGNVQVVDFNEKTHDSGLYTLLDFADGRHVKTVRILAQSKSEETKLSVYLSK
jgi:hypothetical protein